MGFTKALYYPTIDIGNWDWTKSAALFWDNIQTIVPESMEKPYEGKITKILSEEGVLTPHFVNPNMDLIRNLSQDVLNHLQTNEAFDYLVKGNTQNNSIEKDKLPKDIQKLSRLHPEKISGKIRDMLEKDLEKSEWMEVDSRFAGFYMSLLANKICEKEKLVLLTDNSFASNLTDKARLDNQRKIFGNDSHNKRVENTTLNLSQGLLSNLAVSGIRFSPDTDIQKILKFKRAHQDELGLFRVNLEKLVSSIPNDVPLEALQQHVEDIYINEFKPSFNNFKKALNGYKFKWINDNVMKIAFFKAGTGALLPYISDMTIPQAILAGAGISLITSKVSYNQGKEKLLNENPYSYLVLAEKKLSKDSLQRELRKRIY